MKPADDPAVNTKATSGVRRNVHRPRGSVLVGFLAVALLALSPNAAQAEHGFGGTRVGDAKISLTPEGYAETEPFLRRATVRGVLFGGQSVVQIFQCPAGVSPQSVLVECQPLRTVDTDAYGLFVTDVVYSNMFVSEVKLAGQLLDPDPNGPINVCRGSADWHVQCSIVAATFAFNPATQTVEPNDMAEHYISY